MYMYMYTYIIIHMHGPYSYLITCSICVYWCVRKMSFFLFFQTTRESRRSPDCILRLKIERFFLKRISKSQLYLYCGVDSWVPHFNLESTNVSLNYLNSSFRKRTMKSTAPTQISGFLFVSLIPHDPPPHGENTWTTSTLLEKRRKIPSDLKIFSKARAH